MALSTLRLPAAFAAPSVFVPHQTAAVASGSLPRSSAAILQMSASRGPHHHARRQPPPQAANSGHPRTAPTTRLPIVPRPRRLEATEFPVCRRSDRPCIPRASASAPRGPISPRAVDPDQPTEVQGPTARRLRLWGRAADVVSSSPKAHACLVVLLCIIRNPGFEGVLKGLETRFRLNPKLTCSIILGTSMISVLYDLAIGGKDLDDISAYLRRLEKPETASDDQPHD